MSILKTAKPPSPRTDRPRAASGPGLGARRKRPEPAASSRPPSATVADLSTADARSLERQAALVDPDAVVAARRIR